MKKVSGDGHHGGAWKVAYADFVTAMMAFFLLMWLLNATTEDQRKGIADYFNPTIPVSPISGGGKGALNGSSVFTEESLAQVGTGGSVSSQGESDEETKTDTDVDASETGTTSPGNRETESLSSFEEQLLNQVEGGDAGELSQHIQMHVTPEGIVIELVDVDGSPLFNAGSTNSSPTMDLLLQAVSQSLALVSNKISIVGHTDAHPFSGRQGYSNWELSTDRAHVARRLMIEAGLSADQITEVAGKADTQPLVDDVFAPQNRRISITILKS